MAPSTFASAAAAAGSTPTSSRAEGTAEWSRRANGATQTFRRPSHATTSTNSPHQRDSSANQPRTSTEGSGVYIPPHLNASRNGATSEHRYSKDQLLQLFKGQQESENIVDGLPSLYVGGWEPNITNGTSAASWGRRDDHKDNHSADLCWDRAAHMLPLSLNEMTEEEKDIFAGSVNSPLKPPTQTNKEGTPKDSVSNRKSSISQSVDSPGGYGLSSPTSTRPSNRRRETSEAFPFPSTSLTSPGGGPRFSRDDSNTKTPPPALLRRRTDLKDSGSGPSTEERDKDKIGSTDAPPFGGLKRSVTAGLGVSASATWTPTQTSGFSPMGAFGSFAIGSGSGQTTTPVEKRPGFGSMRGESRFKGLMSKDSLEDNFKDIKEKTSMSNLGKMNESEQDRGAQSWMEARLNRPISEDTDPFPDEEFRSGSAALGGGLDASPPRQRGFAGFGPSGVTDMRDDSGFSAFGMTADTIGLRSGEDFSHHTPQQPHRNEGMHEPMSPTDTNPYQSPDNEKTDLEDLDMDGSDIQNAHLPGLGGFGGGQSGLPGLGGFAGLGRVSAPYEVAASDRSQTSSTGPGRGFSGLTGLTGLPGLGGAAAWPPGQAAVGTPTRERSGFGGPFGDAMFSSVGELQSPVLAGLGSGNGFGAAPGVGLAGMGSVGRGSKMGSLFPAAMQEQMRANEQARHGGEEGPFDPFERQPPTFGSFGRSAFGSNAMGAGPPRESDSPFRTGRGVFDEFLASTSRGDIQPTLGEQAHPINQSQHGGTAQTPLSSVPSQETINLHRTSQPQLQRQPSNLASPGSSQPPVAQIRTMVMPDRMKWIYKDPQNKTQGPWSGLEMHDWYKAGFFTPELLIKRLEDSEFEPLAQLIRRIGNSREPFLVPQIGVPHEPPSAQGRALPGSAGPSGAQPPFASSFPSFGTTLTAEQQNALERRKQEEQYLMARQKEHLAQQQLLQRQMQITGQGHGMLPQQLHHHSSAHSLHSQPSFGSITSPGGYQPSPTQGPIAGGQPVPGFFDSSFRAGPAGAMGPMSASIEMLGNIREDELPGMMEQLNLARGAQALPRGSGPFSQAQPQDAHGQQVSTMLSDRARLQREQAEHDARQQGLNQSDFEAHAAAERLQQFHDLRSQMDQELEESSVTGPSQSEYEAAEEAALTAQLFEQNQQDLSSQQHQVRSDAESPVEAPSLTQQVQAAASAKQASAQQTAWTKLDMSTMEPMQRPPQSSSPMPAPIAQRKQNVADNLVAESRSRTQSPSVETPSASIAPWAKEPVEAPKAQSLKEIQEAEAKRAAKQEEMAAAQRRAAFEKELAAAQAAAQTAPAPGLPSGATWASAQSPAGSTGSAPSVWGAKTAPKPVGKTLQQIQKEEEAKKQRAAVAANVASVMGTPSPTITSTGKRYADLAGKNVSPAPAAMPGGGWNTVGAGGKVKSLPPIPTAPAGRSVSGGVATMQAPKPTPMRSTTLGSAQTSKMTKADALEEFKKWAIADLQRGQLNSGIEATSLLETLLAIGSDVEVLTEVVHSSSQTIDSRHFAEEFVRRKKQADKGIVEPSSTASPSSAKSAENAWSAVAKKGQPPVASQEQAFKLAKTKGRRK